MSDPAATLVAVTDRELHARRRNGLPAGRPASGPLGKRILLNRWTWVFVVSALVFAGCLMFQYQLVTAPVKTDDGEGTVVPFKPNRAQRRLISKLWHRNVILKARQLGFTTLVAILWLDHALFNENQRCGIIAQDREGARRAALA